MVTKSRLDKPTLFAGGTNRGFRKATVLVGLEGCGVVRHGPEAVTLGRGDVVVIPAAVNDYSVHGQWSIEYLTVTLPPPVPVEEPQTTL
jgi:mannose-6-phosphate isomerase class I